MDIQAISCTFSTITMCFPIRHGDFPYKSPFSHGFPMVFPWSSHDLPIQTWLFPPDRGSPPLGPFRRPGSGEGPGRSIGLSWIKWFIKWITLMINQMIIHICFPYEHMASVFSGKLHLRFCCRVCCSFGTLGCRTLFGTLQGGAHCPDKPSIIRIMVGKIILVTSKIYNWEVRER